MSSENGAYRWWENYLVRYLMPSIAGAVIVNWLASIGGPDFKKLLLLDAVSGSGLQTNTVVLLFLYGNLFCYISSYPILGFHVTRVIDFEKGEWKPRLIDGYISTLLLAVTVLILSINTNENCYLTSRVLPCFAVFLFIGAQLYRIHLALQQISFKGLTGTISKLYAYAYVLSRRRGFVEETKTRQINTDQLNEDTGETFDEESEWHNRSIWRRELIDSYRHMREHGNSAFIFLLELTLAGLCYLFLIAFKDNGIYFQLSVLGVLFAVWALPAMFIHFVGQHIERRFSRYDIRL